MRAVIIDDNSSLRMLLRLNLEFEAEASVVGEAADGAAGIALIRETQPDVAVVDLHMPGVGGLEVIRVVRDLDLPVRLVAYSADAALLEHADAAGADLSVCKTTDVQELAGRIKELLLPPAA